MAMPARPRGCEQPLEGSKEADLACGGRATGQSRLGVFLTDLRQDPASCSSCLPRRQLLPVSGIFPRQAPPSWARILSSASSRSWAVPRAGVRWRRKGGGGALPQRFWVFLSTLAPSLEEMGFELREAQAVLFLPIIFLSGCLDQLSLDFGFFALKLWQGMRVPEVG